MSQYSINIFKMESQACAIQLMKKTCYMASIDLTDAYYTVPVTVEHRKYFRFFFSGKIDCFNTHAYPTA